MPSFEDPKKSDTENPPNLSLSNLDTRRKNFLETSGVQFLVFVPPISRESIRQTLIDNRTISDLQVAELSSKKCLVPGDDHITWYRRNKESELYRDSDEEYDELSEELGFGYRIPIKDIILKKFFHFEDGSGDVYFFASHEDAVKFFLKKQVEHKRLFPKELEDRKARLKEYANLLQPHIDEVDRALNEFCLSVPLIFAKALMDLPWSPLSLAEIYYQANSSPISRPRKVGGKSITINPMEVEERVSFKLKPDKSIDDWNNMIVLLSKRISLPIKKLFSENMRLESNDMRDSLLWWYRSHYTNLAYANFR